jgi:YggT family protein
MLVGVLMVLILGRVLMSYMNPAGGGALTAFLYQATEPILAPIRRILPPTGGIDWSPTVAILLMGILLSIFVR